MGNLKRPTIVSMDRRHQRRNDIATDHIFRDNPPIVGVEQQRQLSQLARRPCRSGALGELAEIVTLRSASADLGHCDHAPVAFVFNEMLAITDGDHGANAICARS